jgi:cation diffusion facilitator CzcD-associated flavoprotein CzcO
VSRIDRHGDGWLLVSPAGDLHAAHVVVATGLEREPAIPDCSGRDAFTGRILHSAEYRTATPFRGRRVLVVGPGCSGMEIAHDLATGGAAKVWLSARTPPNILIRGGPGPVPGDMIAVALLHAPVLLADAITRRGQRSDVGDLTPYGLPVPDEGAFARLRRLGVSPSIVDREVIESIREGRIEVVRAVESLTATRVELADGTALEADDVICATGYRTGLEPLVGHLGVLGERGVPSLQGGRPAAPGLRFVGFVPRPGGIAYMGRQARAAARAIAREMRDAAVPAEEQIGSGRSMGTVG